MQAEHAGTRTYYFSTDSHEEQLEWIRAMSGAAEVHNDQLIQRNIQDMADLNHTAATKEPDPQTHQSLHTQSESGGGLPPHLDINSLETQRPSSPSSDQTGIPSDGRREQQTKAAEVQEVEGRSGSEHTAHTRLHPNGWGSYDPPSTVPHNNNFKALPSRSYSEYPSADKQSQTNIRAAHDKKDPQEHVVLRRGFVPRTAPERVAQRKSSMAQLQQWVNQRRGMNFQQDLNSPTHYFPVNRVVSADYHSYSGGSQYMDEYSLFPVGGRPDSICSVSAVGGFDRHWTTKEKRRSLRDGSHHQYGLHMPRDSWGPQYYSGMETSMRHLSIHPRSRSVPRSPSSSSGGHYSPVPPNFASPARSMSTRFDRFPGRMREDLIYADPSVYNLRRSLSSPKVPPFHDVYNRELNPTLKLNEIETSKLLGRLCEQNRILRDHEAIVHRLRMDKDSLEEALVATHQEMEFYQNQPLIIEKLQLKKEAHQNQLIDIRGELSQASSALTTTRMEFEALEDEANAIHGDLWEQLNAGGQNELVRRHIQKEFWRVQDVLEGLHKNNLSRGTDTAKHRVTSGASGSFSTNSSASPLSSVSLTSPLSPYSSMLGCQASPTKQFGPEVSTGHSQPGAIPSPNSGTEFSPSAEVCKRVCFKPRPASCLLPTFSADSKPKCRPRSCREPESACYLEHIREHTFSQPTDSFQHIQESLNRLNPVVEGTDQNMTGRNSPNSNKPMSLNEAEQSDKITFFHTYQNSKYNNVKLHLVQTHCDSQHTHWLSEDKCSRDVRIGLRKDVYPDPHLSSELSEQSNSRRLSLPESRLLEFQDSYWTDALSLNYSPDLFIRSLSSFKSQSPDTQQCHQLNSQTETETRHFTYPDNQGELNPNVFSRIQPYSQGSHSGKVFMQTHL